LYQILLEASTGISLAPSLYRFYLSYNILAYVILEKLISNTIVQGQTIKKNFNEKWTPLILFFESFYKDWQEKFPVRVIT